MIKIFGKIRYHWQPDMQTSVIYWSLTVMLLFASLILAFENTNNPQFFLIPFTLFVGMVLNGFHRYFIINTYNELSIVAISRRDRTKIPIASITQIKVSHHGIALFCDRWQSEKIFYMRKWHREPFLEALLANDAFHAQVMEVEHLY